MPEPTTPVDLAAARQRITRAHTELGDVCAQGPSRRFRMHIPADPARDTDLIISAALNDADLLVGEVERLRVTVARVRALRDYLATATGTTETGDLLRKVARNLSDIVDGKSAVSQDETPAAAEQTRNDMIVVAAKALWEREFSTYEECSHTWSEMPRIAAVALDAAGQLIEVDGGASWVRPHTDGEELPENACARIDHEVTGAYHEPGGDRG
ncbi:hypothetical protein AB0O28_18995 [Microbispora sp. NPDC088329]|uniref:hypothetical protein n=1 Tax=Microbispora sp. NPDC088329 TaxID=3154869 RepID=UPI00343155C7